MYANSAAERPLEGDEGAEDSTEIRDCCYLARWYRGGCKTLQLSTRRWSCEILGFSEIAQWPELAEQPLFRKAHTAVDKLGSCPFL